MCIVSVFLKLRISFFIYEGQGDLVLLHPGDDTSAPQNPKNQILIEKLAYKHVHCFCIPRTRISFFLDEGQGVPSDKVLLHPGAWRWHLRATKPQNSDSDLKTCL